MLPKNRVTSHPGEILLLEFLRPMGIKQSDLATALGVPYHAVSEIVHCKRAVSPRLSVLLSRALGTSAEFWAGLQADFDASKFLQSAAGKRELRAVVPLTGKGD